MYTEKEIAMENKLIQSAAKVLAYKLNKYNHKEGLELRKMEIGMEIFLISASKFIIVYSLAVIFGTLWQTMVIHFSFGLLKRYSFGLHALSSTICTIVSCGMFVLTPILLSGMGLSNFGAIAFFGIIIFILYKYAPADTKARPLIGVKLRAKLKWKAVASAFVLVVIALIVPDGYITLLLTVGALYQCILILPITYKILKRSEKNYETYECV